MALLLGVDIGTSSTTGSLVAPDGRLLAQARQAHEVSRPRAGWAEHDAERVWWAGFVAVARELREAAHDAGDEIAAVATSGIGPALLVADSGGGSLRPAILYGIDTRAMGEAAELTERFGVRPALGADSIAPKLLWLARHEPDVFAGARRMLMPQSFVALRLTGRYCIDASSAQDPFFDPEARTWRRDWFAEVCPQVAPPDLVWPADAVGTIGAQGAAASGLPLGIPVAAGTRDSFADAVSVGLSRPGDAVVIYGSTMSTVEVTRDAGSLYVYPDVRMVGSGMATSGALTAWWRSMVGDVDFETLLAEAAASPPGANGLLVLPYFAGERSPLGDPDARGVIAGLTTHHTRGDICRALLEATAFGLRHCLDDLAARCGRFEAPFAVGGGVAHALWPQIVSDVTGRRQRLTTGSAGASYGDAFLAGLASGLVSRDTHWVEVTREVRPDAGVRQLYDSRYALYRALHEATVDIQHELA